MVENEVLLKTVDDSQKKKGVSIRRKLPTILGNRNGCRCSDSYNRCSLTGFGIDIVKQNNRYTSKLRRHRNPELNSECLIFCTC